MQNMYAQGVLEQIEMSAHLSVTFSNEKNNLLDIEVAGSLHNDFTTPQSSLRLRSHTNFSLSTSPITTPLSQPNYWEPHIPVS